MTHSMTGFARASGQKGAQSWAWEGRSVNGRGLEVRLRLPEGYEALEQEARALVAARFARGNVNLALRIKGAASAGTPVVSASGLDAALRAISAVTAQAQTSMVRLADPTPTEVLRMPGVVEIAPDTDDAGLLAEIKAGLGQLLDDLEAARASEGTALASVLRGQVDQIATLAQSARDLLPRRRDHVTQTMSNAIARLVEEADALDVGRLEQELAQIAVKSDVAEELDRLDAHVTAARALISKQGPVGRKFDFLTQEFNREANTLCAKAGFAELTAIGLELKTVIDQMREQVQNVE